MLFSKPYHVILVADGQVLKDIENVKSFKVDIAQYVRKYMIDPPKDVTTLPPEYIKSQLQFYERAYLELLDLASTKLDMRTRA